MIQTIKEIDLSNDAIGSAAYAQVGDDINLGYRYDRITVQVENISAASGDALQSFVLQVKTHPSATWVDYLGRNGLAWTDASVMHYVKPSPDALDKDAVSYIHVFMGLAYAIRFKAKAETGKTAKLKILGTAYMQGK